MSTRVGLSLAVVGIVAGLTLVAQADAANERYAIANETVYDTKTKLTWQRAVPSDTYTWAGAKAYCAAPGLAGAGWRLPTAKELQTIVDESRANPAINTTAFPSTPSGLFWTSSLLASSPSKAWFVNFNRGDMSTLVVSYPYYVRCVR